MRIGLDATPLLGSLTGIGTYTAQLIAALSDGPDELVATAFTWRSRRDLQSLLPPSVTATGRRAPARGLQQLWARAQWPPVELLAGPMDVFHATNYVLPPLRRAAGVVTVHDLAYLRMTHVVDAASARYRQLVPRSLRRAAAVITDSQAVADQIQEAYAPTVPVVPVPLGVDPAWGEARPADAALRSRLGLPSSYVLFVGTLEPRKDLATLLAAHAQMQDPPPLVLVGGRGWGEQLDLSRCITPGYLERHELLQVVAGASVLALPSRDEGFGLPLLEAMAAGVPVVASDLPVLKEVGGDVARYAPVGDAEAFAAALQETLTDPGDPAALRRQAAPFTWQRTASLTRAVYGSVAS